MDALLAAALDPPVDSLPADGLVDALMEAERIIAALQARSQRLLARLLAEDTSGREFVAEEVACALRLAPVTAVARMHQAAEAVGRFPRMIEALEAGETTLGHVRALAEATRHLGDEVAADAEDRLLSRAGSQTVGEFRSSARHVAARLAPALAEERHELRLAERRVAFYPDEDGMATVWAYLSAERAAALRAAIEARVIADGDQPDDERTIDQRRADAFAALADPVGDSDAARTSLPGGGRAQVSVVVPLATLLDCSDEPGQLAGFGPIPARVAQELAADPRSTWRRLVTDEMGRVIDTSRSYAPPPSLREHVRSRDRTCRFPGCRRAAGRCEIDHVVPFGRGGPTQAPNLHTLCPRHHRLKHEGGWSVRRIDDVSVWTSPGGRRYVKPPDDPLEG